MSTLYKDFLNQFSLISPFLTETTPIKTNGAINQHKSYLFSSSITNSYLPRRMHGTCYFQYLQSCHESENVRDLADIWERVNSKKMQPCFTDPASNRTLHEGEGNIRSRKMEKCSFLYLIDPPHIFYNDYCK